MHEHDIEKHKNHYRPESKDGCLVPDSVMPGNKTAQNPVTTWILTQNVIFAILRFAKSKFQFF